jgi:thiol-disulfide isomerase/thioredoxin
MGFDFWGLESVMRVVIALIPMMLLAACDKQPTPAPQPNTSATPEAEAGKLDTTHRGKAIAPSVFTAPNGKPVTLAAFKGKPVLVNLWATWCGPCVKEMPSLDRLAKRGAGKLVVLTVNQTDNADAIAKWWTPRQFTMLQPYRDEDGKLGFDFESGVLPTTVLYDAQGKEVWRIVGGMDWDGARAKELLAGVLG